MLPNSINIHLCSAPSLTDIKVDNGSGKKWELFRNDISLDTHFTGWLIKNCPVSLCSPTSKTLTPGQQSLCTAIKSIQDKSSGASGFKDTISALNTKVSILSEGAHKDALQLLVNVFSDFLTLYTDCSETVHLLNSDFCATIRYAKIDSCNLPNPSIKLYTLNWLLTNDTTGVPGFTDWGSLFTRNMKMMLFCAKNPNLGQNFAAALKTLGISGKNPFLNEDQTIDLCTGVQNMDSSNTATGTPIFNFETNFQQINTKIQTIIDNDKKNSN